MTYNNHSGVINDIKKGPIGAFSLVSDTETFRAEIFLLYQ